MLSVPEYVHEALKKLAEEEKIAERYYPTSQKVVITAIEDVVIVKPCKILADVTARSSDTGSNTSQPEPKHWHHCNVCQGQA